MTPDDAFETGFAAALLRPDAPPPPGLGQRFAVHRNTVMAGLATALGESFPAVRALVGAEFFRGAALAWAGQEPPRTPVLHEWGAGFPAFLAGFPPAATLPFLPDVARLEWAVLRALHAAEAPVADVAALAALPEDDLPAVRLVPHPGAALVPSRYAIVSLWREVTLRAPQTDLDLGQGECALVTRPEAEVRVAALDPLAAALARAAFAGRSLGEIECCTAPVDALGRALATLFGSGLVTRVATG